MPRPANMEKLKKTIDRLSFAEKQMVAEWVKANPEIEKLEQQKAEIEARLAELTGGTTPVAKRPGRKPGRKPAKAVSKLAKTPKATKATKGRPGRKPKTEADTEAPKRKPGRPAKAEKAPKTAGTASPAKLAALEKARATRAANRAAVAGTKPDVIEGEAAPKRRGKRKTS